MPSSDYRGYDRYLVAKALQAVLSRAGLYRGVIDGIWGPISQAAYEKFNQGERL